MIKINENEILYTKVIYRSDEEITNFAYSKAKELYGEELPKIVEERLAEELDCIIRNENSSIFMIMQKIVTRANDQGYTIGTRGAVASSFIAYLIGMTQINPLYVHGGNYEIDMPFEVFLGSDEKKELNFQLNIPEEYIEKAEKHLVELCGKDGIFKVSKQVKEEVRKGIYVIVPKDKEIYDFIPKNKIQENNESDMLVIDSSHHTFDKGFDKIWLLPHNDYTKIKDMQDLTGVTLSEIRLDDIQTLSIFNGSNTKGIDTFKIPEFGNMFIKELVNKTKAKTFEDLVRVSSLSHGTGTWIDNAENLIENNIATLSEVISSREDLMIYLIKHGIDRKTAYQIMEIVRMGKVSKNKEEWRLYVKIMKEKNIPNWYIESCEKIKYLFPKSDSVARTLIAYKIAWFKMYYPLEYYSVYLSKYGFCFEYNSMMFGKDVAKAKMEELISKGETILEDEIEIRKMLKLIIEMYQRGIKLLPPNEDKSDELKYVVENGKIRVPKRFINK